MKSPAGVLNFILYDFINEINDQLFPYKEKRRKRRLRFPTWHNKTTRPCKVKEKEEQRSWSAREDDGSWSSRSSDEDPKEKLRKEHFDSWLQEKIKKEKELKRRKKRAEETMEKIKQEKEIIQAKLRNIMKEEWLKKKMAQEKEESEKKRREKEEEELEKRKKESVSRMKVNQWMDQSKRRVRRPVDQSLYSQSH